MATAINNVSRRTSPSFAQTTLEFRMVSDRVCESHRRKLWRSFTKATRKRKKERNRAPSSLLRGSPPRRAPLRLWRDLTRQWHGNSDVVQGQHATTKKRSQVVGRMRHELLFSPCTIPPCPRFPSHRCCLPRCCFSSGLHDGVICRYRDDDGESQLRENRTLSGMRSARWLLRMENSWKSAFALEQKDLSILRFPAGLSGTLYIIRN